MWGSYDDFLEKKIRVRQAARDGEQRRYQRCTQSIALVRRGISA
jgi:hypothetical protein